MNNSLISDKTVRAVFNSVSKIHAILIFINEWKGKPKPIVTFSHAFSRAWRRLHVFASNCDCFIVYSTLAAIGQSNYFAFDFFDAQLQTALLGIHTESNEPLGTYSKTRNTTCTQSWLKHLHEILT